MRKTIGLAVLFTLLAAAALAEELKITAPARLRPYQANEIRLDIPYPGTVAVTLSAAGQDHTVLAVQSTQAGAKTIACQALGFAGEPLTAGEYILTARLDSAERKTSAQVKVRVGAPLPALQFALPSADTLYLQQPDLFYVEYALAAPGTARVELLAAGQNAPVKTWSITHGQQDARIFRFDGKVGGKALAPGDYLLRFTGADNNPRQIELTVAAGMAPVLPLKAEAQPQLEEMEDEAAVWAVLQQPVTVMAGGELAHYPIRSPQGMLLGHVHGQTAGVQVLELAADGTARVGAWRTQDGQYIEGYMEQSHLMRVVPNPHYGLVIDKRTQTMAVYQDGKKLGLLAVSTGLPTAKKLFRETPAGQYLTQERVQGFASEGFRYDYPIRIDGGNLLHQVGARGKEAPFALQEAQLGQKASHGCVRVARAPLGESPEPLSAYWLWTHLPPRTKVLVIDDPQQRADQLMAMGLGPFDPDVPPPPLPGGQAERVRPQPSAAPAENTLPASQATPAPQVEVTMTFAGDCVLGGEDKTRAKPDSFDAVIAKEGNAWPFSGMAELFAGDDLSLVNLECVFKDDSANKQPRLWNFRGPTAFTAILKDASVEMVNIANNHHADYGAAGRRSTIGALEAAGIEYAGYGRLALFEKQGVRIGFGGIRETSWRQNKKQMEADIAALRAAGCHMIVYSCHFGKEYAPSHNALQTQIAHMAIDLGADLVIGHHPHVAQGVEYYKNGMIFYSLGNFAFGGNHELTTFDGVLLSAKMTFRTGEIEAGELRLIPVLTSGSAPQNDFRPIAAQGEDVRRILAKIQADTPFAIGNGTFAWGMAPPTLPERAPATAAPKR